MDKLNLIDFEKYTITKDGKIFSKWANRYMLGSPNRDGYLTISLSCIDNKPRVYYYHRVIWFYFNGDIPKGLEINHKDEDKANNSLDNLELLTRADNIRYGTRGKRAAITNSLVQKGRKLTEEHIHKIALIRSKPLIQYDIITKKPIKEWQSSKQVARELGYNDSTIGKACRGIYSQAYGYLWKYI